VAEEVTIQLSGFFFWSVAQSVTQAVLLSITKILGCNRLGLMPFVGEYQYQTPGRSLGLSQHHCVLNSGLLYLTRLLMFLGSRPVRATDNSPSDSTISNRRTTFIRFMYNTLLSSCDNEAKDLRDFSVCLPTCESFKKCKKP